MLFWGPWLEAFIIATIAIVDVSNVVLDVAHELLCGRRGGAEKSSPFLILTNRNNHAVLD